MASDPQRQSLPFEPKNTNKANTQKTKTAPAKQTAAKGAAKDVTKASPKSKIPAALRPKGEGQRQPANSIPEVVSRRMIRRMVAFSGIPTILGLGVFVGAYLLISRQILEFPKSLVLVLSLACFGLGFLGLSYGVLSASWEEDTEGSLLGATEFSLNFRRMIRAWKEAKQS
ncbi:MAG: PAM68 family protein [Cyanobacteria bacterium J06635_1]